MSTLDIGGLTQLLESLSVSGFSSNTQDASVLSNPLDLLRATLATLLISLVECDVTNAYKAVQWPNSIYNGDLSVTLPRLCPGCAPKELSSQIVNKVRTDRIQMQQQLAEPAWPLQAFKEARISMY
jgi:arginyl-tRNA synthetase